MAIKPGIISWNRLEPRPRTEDDDRTLRVEVRDALWMMTRQWQFGEFQADDTASAIFSEVHMKTSKINRVQFPNRDSRKIEDIPLEADIEKECIQFDFLMRLEMGRYWEKLLTVKIKNASSNLSEVKVQELISEVITRFRTTTSPENFQFFLPEENVNNAGFYCNPSLFQSVSAVSKGRAIDGKKVYDWLNENKNNPVDFLSGLDIKKSVLTETVDDFFKWFKRNYTQAASANDSAWMQNNLEYKFAVSAPNEAIGNPDVLVADEYYHGKLDWYAFDFDKHSSFDDFVKNDSNNKNNRETTDEKFTLIPTTISFPGMPHPRWWQMENRNIDLGDINPSTTDIAKIVFSEFGLIYSNDWMVFPYSLDYGSLCDLKSIIVTDCFGQRTKIQAASSGKENDWERWSFFGLSTKIDPKSSSKNIPLADTRLYIPAVTENLLESDAIESVNFIKDEMANMVWGIEQIIPNGMGGGMNGYETALKHLDYLKKITNKTIVVNQENSLVENEAKITYKIANTMPENWIPFIPSMKDGAISNRQTHLRRAAMPRYLEGALGERIRPKTSILQYNDDGPMVNEDWKPYHIFEEEIPRSGAIVKRTWQRTRTENGKVVTWIGKRKTNGRGEGSSNLTFDNIEDKK